MHLVSKRLRALTPWAAAVLSALLLELPFPIAGPMPPARALFACCALLPLLWALLPARGPALPAARAFRIGYLAGVLWYAGNCYWIYDTMCNHGGLPPAVALLILLAFSLALGAYFGLFGLAVATLHRATGRTAPALLAAPFVWVCLDLLAARFTSVPWDQLGYSQVDNALANLLAPWTGVYGITFVLVAINALLAAGLLLNGRRRILPALAAGLLILALAAGLAYQPAVEAPTATAILTQPNLDVAGDNFWNSDQWQQATARFRQQATTPCTPYLAGIPETGAPLIQPDCSAIVAPATLASPQAAPAPSLRAQGLPQTAAQPQLAPPQVVVAWPESPAPFSQEDPRFQSMMLGVAQTAHATVVTGGIGTSFDRQRGEVLTYNSAMLFAPNGQPAGRYDKIHLVPYGEYIPYKDLFTFAHKLTGRVSEFERGRERKVFDLNGNRYGIFICYEAVFADEVRLFAKNGAQVFLNLSDDGWYGNTSAPWQHLNMTRMRAMENRRWILRATNNGVTAAIDPYGRVRQSIPRNQIGALAAQYGFRSDVTFYSAHGDVFALACALLALAGWTGKILFAALSRKL